MTRFAAILSGGVGERFWPVSTPERPKQLLPLLGGRTMLRETLDRLLPLFPPERILIMTSGALAAAVGRECPELPAGNVIAEPRPRNTAAAVGVAACAALGRAGEGSSLALLPADHLVREREAFLDVLRRAFDAAEAQGRIVTLGVAPDRPETGYGYVTRGEALPGGVFRIEAFHEKPDAARAEELVRGGRSAWNAGMFIAPAATLLGEIEAHVPELGAALRRLLEAGGPGAGERGEAAFRELYERAPSISFDHAVMERTGKGAVLPADVGWDDVGSWEAMARFLDRDEAGNVVHGEGRVAHGRDNILFSEGGRITLVGADNLVVVSAGAETFVCSRERLPELKEILRALNDSPGSGSGPREGGA